jgi:hypothetical protein
MGYYLKNSTVIAETKQENMAFAREKKSKLCVLRMKDYCKLCTVWRLHTITGVGS